MSGAAAPELWPLVFEQRPLFCSSEALKMGTFPSLSKCQIYKDSTELDPQSQKAATKHRWSA